MPERETPQPKEIVLNERQLAFVKKTLERDPDAVPVEIKAAYDRLTQKSESVLPEVNVPADSTETVNKDETVEDEMTNVRSALTSIASEVDSLDEVRRIISGESEPEEPITQPKPVIDHEEEEEKQLDKEYVKISTDLEIILLTQKAADDRAVGSERRRLIQRNERKFDLEYIFGDDLEDDDQEKNNRRRELRNAAKSLKSGVVTKDQEEILRNAGVDTEALGIQVTENAVENRPQGTETERIISEIGCTQEQFDAILKYCMDQIFIGGLNNTNQVIGSIGGESGIWATLKGKRTPIPAGLRERLLKMEFGAWIEIRNTMSQWNKLKNVDDITPGVLTQELFVPRITTESFSNLRNVRFPSVESGYSKTEENVNVSVEISKAMKVLYENVGESWNLVGTEPAERSRFYEELGLNRYFGEAAFVYLLSNLMLTKKSKLDPFILMVNNPEKRIKNYNVSVDRDPFVRMLVQDQIVESGSENRETTVEALQDMLPTKLVPTGLDRGGMQALMSNSWMEWTMANYRSMSTRDLDIAQGKTNVPPATDIETQLGIMRSALDVLTLTKEALKPDSKLDKLAALKSKLFIHSISKLQPAGWTHKTGDSEIMDSIFCIGGRPQNTYEWVSRYLLSIDEVYIFTHSLADHLNTNPLAMSDLGNNIQALFSEDPQSKKMNYFGFYTNRQFIESQKRELVDFVDSMWDRCFVIVDKVATRSKPEKYPKWYSTGAMASPEIYKICEGSGVYRGEWPRIKKRMGL